MNGLGFATVNRRYNQGNRWTCYFHRVVQRVEIWRTVTVMGERGGFAGGSSGARSGEARNQGGELREHTPHQEKRGIGTPGGGPRIPDHNPEVTSNRSVSWAFKHWVLQQRGWDADKAMMVLDLGNRLDRPSIIDLISQARPNGLDD